MIWAEPAADHPYSAPEYEPFWAAAQDLNMPLSLHILTGRGGTGPTEQSGMMFNLATIHHAIERTLVVMVYGGVLEKFPRLTIVSAENDVGWMAYLMYRLDTVQNRMGTLGGMKLPMRASDYIKRQVYATFIADPRIRRTTSCGRPTTRIPPQLFRARARSWTSASVCCRPTGCAKSSATPRPGCMGSNN
jgi:predicted TIM-barrel fold metal-dependent hydrolase